MINNAGWKPCAPAQKPATKTAWTRQNWTCWPTYCDKSAARRQQKSRPTPPPKRKPSSALPKAQIASDSLGTNRHCADGFQQQIRRRKRTRRKQHYPNAKAACTVVFKGAGCFLSCRHVFQRRPKIIRHCPYAGAAAYVFVHHQKEFRCEFR